MRLDVRDIAAQRRALGEHDYRFPFDVAGQDGLDVATAQADVDHAGMAIVTAERRSGRQLRTGIECTGRSLERA